MKVAFCLVGTRRGHAARAIAVGGELIRRGHLVRFYTDRDAYELLRERFGEAVCVQTHMPTYAEKDGVIQPLKTFFRNLPFLIRRRKRAEVLIENLRGFEPDLGVSDFEPLGTAAARHFAIPLISLNSQNFLGNASLPAMPLSTRLQLHGIQLLTRALCPKPDLKIACKAFVRPHAQSSAVILGPCIRPELRGGHWRGTDRFVLAYLQDGQINDALALQGFCEANHLGLHLYGPSSVPSCLQSVHRAASVASFSRDLISCRMLVCSSGSQLLGEAAYLGIPTLIRPEPNQAEQVLNAHLAVATVPHMLHDESPPLDTAVLAKILHWGATKGMPHLDGTEAACDAIEAHMHDRPKRQWH